jgi:iron complex outermembrane receptor protein
MKKYLFLTVVLLAFSLRSQPLYAQTGIAVHGIVFNAETGEPLPNAHIAVVSSQSGSSSDAEGHFELRLEEGRAKIRVTSVGFGVKESTIRVMSGSRDTVKVGLVPLKFEIGGVDVFGKHTFHGGDTSVNRVPLSYLPVITRINAAEIEKMGATTLVDALRYVPGGWTENRGRKTKQFFAVRGQKYPYPDYSINGVWQKEFEETGYFLTALDIESVELVRSGNALVKGLSGLTGVIDVKTKKPSKESFSLTAKYGELNTHLSHLQYGNKIKGIWFTASASLFGTSGIPGRKGKEQIANFHGDIDWELSPTLKLSAGATSIRGLREFVNIVEPGAQNIMSREEKFDPVRTLLTYAKVNHTGSRGSLSELQVNMSLRDAVVVSYSIPQDKTTVTPEKDWEYGFNFLHSRPLTSTNKLRFGALYNHWVAPEGKRYYTGRPCDVHTWSGVITDEQKAGKFLVDAGVRFISGYIVEFGGFGIEGSATGFQQVAPITDQMAPPEWQAVGGLSFLPSGQASLHYNFAGGTIAPRKGSILGSGETPDTEGRFQHDLGLRLISPNQDEITLSGFFTQRNNAIDYSGKSLAAENGTVVELYENLDKQSYGVEMSARVNVRKLHSSLFANGLWMKGKKESEGSMVRDGQLPELILNGGIAFQHAGFDASFYANYTGKYTNNRFVNPAWVKTNGDFPLGDFLALDLTAGYTFTGKLHKRVFMEVRNLLDKKYMTVAGYPEPGRIFSSGFKLYF